MSAIRLDGRGFGVGPRRRRRWREGGRAARARALPLAITNSFSDQCQQFNGLLSAIRLDGRGSGSDRVGVDGGAEGDALRVDALLLLAQPLCKPSARLPLRRLLQCA